MKISKILFAVPDILLFLTANGSYLFLCLFTALWVHGFIEEARGKRYYDPLCGMGIIFFLFWLITTIVFCGYWGNQFQEWGY